MSEYFVVVRTRKLEGFEDVWEEKICGPIPIDTPEKAAQSVMVQMRVAKENIARVYYEQHY
jgi:hypothetical protein